MCVLPAPFAWQSTAAGLKPQANVLSSRRSAGVQNLNKIQTSSAFPTLLDYQVIVAEPLFGSVIIRIRQSTLS